MNLHKHYLTENDCYKANTPPRDSRYSLFQTRGPAGIMVHSTGANNPYLWRYVGPNSNQNDWNRPGVGACVHAFIGLNDAGEVETDQTLPWNFRGWHCGDSANNTHVSFEICEDGLEDPEYFAAVYQEAVELCAYLCKLYGLTPGKIICHSEGAALGIASNHADVMHWFPKHGKSMDTLRADVAELLAADVPAPAPDPMPDPIYTKLSEMSDYLQDGVRPYIDDGSLRGYDDERGLDLTDREARLLTIAHRHAVNLQGGGKRG